MKKGQMSIARQHSTWKHQNITDTEVDFEWAVKLNRFTLNLIGLWPKTEQNFRQRLMCNFRVLVIVLSIVLGLLIPCIHSLARIFGDSLLMIDNLQVTLPALSCLIRIIIFWWKKEAIEPITNMIMEDWVKPKETQERNMMIRRAQSARIINITCGYCIMAVSYIFFIILPAFGISMRHTNNITDPGGPMLVQTHYVYDVTKSPQYELTFISQIICVTLAMIIYSGIDNFFGLLILHICGQLDILKNRLTNLDKYINYHEILKSCITRHLRLLRAIDSIEDTFNVLLLFLFIYFAITFAFFGFQIKTLFNEGNYISLPLIYFVSTVINMFAYMGLYCALGEILVAQCNKIYYAAYSNKWYTMNRKVTKILLLLMIRGSKPVYLTAGKLFPLTMATFYSLIQTSFGYISVLYTLRN